MTHEAVWADGLRSLSASIPQTGTTAVQVWTLIVAGLAVVATIVAAILLRWTGNGTVKAANKAAEASERSAQAAEKSANAAQESVGVNRESAAGVAERAHADALSKRYQDAAAQLGHEKSAVRLAGVYAMGRLADDWPEQRQQCVNVLCAYLRMPWPESPVAPGSHDPGEEPVRRTILEVIADHVDTRSTGPSWSDLRFDFTGGVLPRVKLMRCLFNKRPNFTRCTFTQEFFFAGTLAVGADFNDAEFWQRVIIGELIVKHANINFEGATLKGWTRIEVEDLDPSAGLRLDGTTILNDVDVQLLGSTNPQGHIDLRRVTLAGGRLVVQPYQAAALRGPNSPTVSSGSWVNIKSFDRSHFSAPGDWNQVVINDGEGAPLALCVFLGVEPPALI